MSDDYAWLDPIKLVDEKHFADPRTLESDVTHLIEVAAGTNWTLNREIRVVLALAKALRDTREAASNADELAKKVKALQLENGRLKAKIGRLEAAEAGHDQADSALSGQQ